MGDREKPGPARSCRKHSRLTPRAEIGDTLWSALKAVAPYFIVVVETHHTVGEPDTPPMLDRFPIVRTDHDQSTLGLARVPDL
jgi:hypothetical protein